MHHSCEESSYRMDEHIVKCICQVCRSAAGPNLRPEKLSEGATSPLSFLRGERTGPSSFEK